MLTYFFLYRLFFLALPKGLLGVICQFSGPQANPSLATEQRKDKKSKEQRSSGRLGLPLTSLWSSLIGSQPSRAWVQKS